MYLEFIVGPLVAVAISMKFTVYKQQETIKALEAKITEVHAETINDTAEIETRLDNTLAKKMLTVLKPVAIEVQKVKDAVGV